LVSVQLEGGFKEAPTEELAKRKIVKARRSCKGTAGSSEAPSETEAKVEVKAASFSWTSTPTGNSVQLLNKFYMELTHVSSGRD
jgi:hypothetical protein